MFKKLLSTVLGTPGETTDDQSLESNPAPLFELENQDNKVFKLEDRKGKGWTVLFFYPKAGTPGCTKQACAFRDSVTTIKNQGAEVYGISADTVESQKKFHNDHHLAYDLLADKDAATIKKYKTKMLGIGISKRVTFIIDDKLIVRKVFLNVDPSLDATLVSKALEELKQTKGVE